MSTRTKIIASILGAVMAGSMAASAAASPARTAGTYAPPGINGATPVSTQLSEMARSNASTAVTTAYDATGVCSGGNVCWRDNNGPLDAWARDIAGDPKQQFLVTYWGQANQGADGGACSQFGNIGVYTFVSPADGYKLEGAAYFSGGVYYAGGGTSNTRYTNWVWLSSGVLENCGDSQNGAIFALEYAGLYTQMYTANTGFGNTWQQIHV